MIFDDRSDAGRRLAAALPDIDPRSTLVIALPRGGVPVAAEICAAHGVPMELVFVRKIGAPHQPELALGAVTDGNTPHVTVNPEVARHLGMSRAEIERLAQDLLPEIERRKARYLHGRQRAKLAGKTLIVVDDGVATGTTLLASLKALKAQGPAQIIAALPVAPRGFAAKLEGLADVVICLNDRAHGAVGAAYRSFAPVDDATVIRLMDRFGARGSDVS